MNAFAPRRSTETQISDAITLGWRIAALYSLRADELPSSPPDNLLPMRRSLPAAQRIALELRAAAGDADRLGVGLDPAKLAKLLGLAFQASTSHADEAEFREHIRAWHIQLETMLWADHEATGKAYELGSFLADTSNRVVCGLRRSQDPCAYVTSELKAVFERARIERIKRLLDDLQARIDPAAVRIVGEHLDAWHAAVQERAAVAPTRDGLAPLDSQTTIWCQLVTGDKEPEAFIGHEERARVRGTMTTRTLRSYARHWRSVLTMAGVVAVLVAFIIVLAPGIKLPALLRDNTELLVGFAGSIAGALGLSLASVGRTVRKSLDVRAELLWNTALVDVISQRTLRIDDVLAPAPGRSRRLPRPVTVRRSAPLLRADHVA